VCGVREYVDEVEAERGAARVRVCGRLKDSIGKDLMRISFPVFFNKPMSMLQWLVSVFFFGRVRGCE
jgi:Na+-driven multidrug efflux pump